MISCDGDRCMLQGAVNIGNVVTVLEEARPLLTAPHVTVDLGGLTEVDSTTVSLLLEWRRAAQRENRKITYVNLSANLKSLAELYGVMDLLGEG